MKKSQTLTLFLIIALIAMTGCQNNYSQQGVDLDRVLKIMSDSMTEFEQKNGTMGEQEAISRFAVQFQKDLNTANPKVHPEKIGVTANNDGSFMGYNDKNGNNTQDSGERKLFTIEIDSQNNRLLASEGQQVREHRAGSGFLMGMLVGSMLSRQRTAGVNTNNLGNKKTTPKQPVNSAQRRNTTSARSRSGSGSYSRGK